MEGAMDVEYPKGGLIGKTVGIVRRISTLNIPLHAANTGFFLILSFFPALLLLLGLLRYTPLKINTLLGLLEGLVPDALLPEAEYLILSTYESASGTLLGVSAATALWSASRGIWGLGKGLNAVYGVREERSWLRTRCLSVVYTFGFLLVLVLTLVIHVFGSRLAARLAVSPVPIFRFLAQLRLIPLVPVQTVLFTAMFMALPNRHDRFRDSLPGAVLCSVGWLVFSELFSLYVEYFPSYANVYGSVYAVALSMLWLYFCVMILLYGGLLNRVLAERKKR